MPYHFTQPCPTCGRHMRIAIDLLGRKVACQHCHAEFISSADDGSCHAGRIERPLMERVEEILQRSSALQRTSSPRPLGSTDPV